MTVVLATWVALVTLASAASAEIYMYRDKNGSLHFSNAPARPGYRQFLSDLPPTRRVRVSTAADRARRRAFDPIIRDAANRYRIDSALIKAVIHAESDFVPYAVSPKGALGLMQLMPATARRHGVWRVFDPRENVEGGVRYLRWLLDRYAGNVHLALAAYNAGEGAVDRYGGIPPYRETRNYLDRVLEYRQSYLRDH